MCFFQKNVRTWKYTFHIIYKYVFSVKYVTSSVPSDVIVNTIQYNKEIKYLILEERWLIKKKKKE